MVHEHPNAANLKHFLCKITRAELSSLITSHVKEFSKTSNKLTGHGNKPNFIQINRNVLRENKEKCFCFLKQL